MRENGFCQPTCTRVLHKYSWQKFKSDINLGQFWLCWQIGKSWLYLIVNTSRHYLQGSWIVWFSVRMHILDFCIWSNGLKIMILLLRTYYLFRLLFQKLLYSTGPFQKYTGKQPLKDEPKYYIRISKNIFEVSIQTCSGPK